MKIQVHRLLQWITLVSLAGIAIFLFFQKTSVTTEGKANTSKHKIDVFSSSNLSSTLRTEATLCGSATGQSASLLPGTFWQNPIKDFQRLIAIQEQMRQEVNRAVLPFAPVITATKTDALFTDNGSTGATPGDVIEYTIVIMNSGMIEATGVSFMDMIDANTTLVPGSVDATPLARDDSYTSIGNVGISVPAGNGLLANDVDPDNAPSPLMVTAVDLTGTQGQVTFNAAGDFTFTPTVGFEGMTTFSYTLSDGTLTDMATVTITVSNMIWFINSSSVAATEDGRLNTPFKSIANFQAVNDGMGNNPAAGDYIFLHTGSGNYSGPITLLDNQKLIGQGASASLATITGFAIPTYSNPLPTTGGTNPVITTTVAATNAITLGMNNLIRGLTVGNTTGYKIIGTNFGTVTIGDVTTPDVSLNGTGPALSLTTGALAGRINQLTSSSGGNNVVLSGVSGTLNPVSGTIASTAAGAAFSVTGSNPTIIYPGTIMKTGSTGQVVNINGTTGNSITFSSAVSGDNLSNGVNINNANGNVTFPSITLGTSGARLTTTAITINGGTGTYNLGVLSAYSNNTTTFSSLDADGTINCSATSILDATNGTAISITKTVIGSPTTTLGLTFATINSSNTNRGISIQDANGSFTVSGDGATPNSGGTISNTSDNGGLFNNVSNVALNYMNINNNGNATSEDCLRMIEVSGTLDIKNCSLSRGYEEIVHIENTGTKALTVTVNNSTFTDTRFSMSGANGLSFQNFGLGMPQLQSNISVTNCTFTNIKTIGALFHGNGSARLDANFTSCTVDPTGTNNGRGVEVAANNTSQVTFDINNNPSIKSNGGIAINVVSFNTSTIEGHINNNGVTMGGVGTSGSGVAIQTADDSNGKVEVKGNTISDFGFDTGIYINLLQPGGGTLNATIDGNALTTTDAISLAAIYTNSGTSNAGQTHSLCLNVKNNAVNAPAGVNAWFLATHTGSTINLQGTGANALQNWQNNINTPFGGPVDASNVVGGTLTIGGVCTTPAPLVDNPVVMLQTPGENTPEAPVEAATIPTEPTTPETQVAASNIPATGSKPDKKNNNAQEKNLLSGETVTVNGSGSGFNLLPGESTTIKFRVTINSPLPLGTCQISNQGTVTADGGISIMTDDPSVGGATDPTVTPLATMTLGNGNLVYKDNNKNGVFDGGDAGIDNVTLNLYRDVNANGMLDVGDGASIANTTTAGGGIYSFPNLCSGNYIVQVDPGEFLAGGQLYDNGLMAALLSSPIGGASDPDDNVDNDDNGDPVMGFGVATQAITLDYSGMNVEVNNTLDLGFKTPTTITISDVTMAEGSGGGTTNFNFTVTRSDNTEAFNLTVNTADGTAIAPGDYTAITNGMVSFTAGGSITAMVTVVVNADNLVESDETFTVTLSGAPSGVVLTDASGTGTIQNDDAAVISIAATTQAAEDATNGLFTISTTNQFDAPVTVNFTVTGTATSGTDYTSIGTSIVFPANTSSVTIPVDVIADMIVEANETVIVTLTSFMPANPSITIAAGPNNSATVTITDNDQAVITIMDVSMVEGNVGPSNFSFKVTLDKQVDAAVSVNYMTVDGTATQPGDYTSTSNTLTFPANSPAGTMLFIDVPVNGDLVFESNETFTVKLDGLAAGGRNVILSGGGMMLSGTGTILNDDIPPVIINEIDVANSGVDNMEFIELYDGGVGNTNLSGLVLVLYNGANDLSYRAADLDGYFTDANGYFVIGNSGVPGVDLTFPNNTLQNGADAVALYTANGTDFPNGTAVTTTNLIDAIVYDTNNADDAGLLVLLNAGQPQVNEAGNGSAPCHSLQRIPNGSGGPRNTNTYQALPPTPDAANGVPIVTISVAPVSAVENGGPNMVYTVTRTGNTSCSLDVPYTISGTATNGNDYANIPSFVTIPAGMTSATIIVDPSNDQIVELDETVIITLTDGAAYDLGMNFSATGTILNDDNAVISVNSVSNPESTTPFQFTVSISRRVDVAVTVEFSTSNGTATTGDNDYNAVVSQLVTFPAGSNADQIVNVTVNNDTKVEADEVFNVTIANLMNSGRAVTLGTAAGTGTIQNDDAATLTIDDVSMLEGISGTQIYTFTVTLNADVQGGVMVDYITANNTATAGSDYVATNGTLNFAGTANETKQIMVTVNGDCVEEPDETFFVNLSNIVTTAAPGAVTFADAQGQGTIQNDDATFVGGIIYVDASAPLGGDGVTWGTAFNNLQDALRIACTCGMTPQIWVADGTYYPDQGVGQINDDRTSTFQLCNGVAVYGGFAGGETMLSQRDIFANIAVLSGDIDGNDIDANNDDIIAAADIVGNNAYHVTTASGTNNTARLDGFTITAGNASDFGVQGYGGGMYNISGSPTVVNCTFTGNSIRFEGGGMYNENSSNPVVTNCIFLGNTAGAGGGMSNYNSSSPTITNCIFAGNSVSSFGGGIENFISSSPTLINCLFSGNSSGDKGGGMWNASLSNPMVINCTFSGNSAVNEGGGMYNSNSVNPIIINCIIWNNQDNSGAGTANSSIVSLLNSTPTITYSLIQGQNPAGLGNKNGMNVANDPDFVAPVSPASAPTTAGDYRLQISSFSVIDMGDDTAVPTDSKDVDDDGDMAEPTPDLDLNNRIVGAMVDLGAFEFPCAADAGEIANSLTSNNLTICQGTDPGFTFSAENETTDAAYLYAFLLANNSGTILQFNTTGDFDLTTLAVGTYTVYGLSYANFNTPNSIAAYLMGKTIADIQTDDAGTVFCLELTDTPVDGQTNVINIQPNPVLKADAQTAYTYCSREPISIDLNALIEDNFPDGYELSFPNFPGGIYSKPEGFTNKASIPFVVDLVIVAQLCAPDGGLCCELQFGIGLTILPEPVGEDLTTAVCSDDALNINLQDQITNNLQDVTFTYTVMSSNQANVPAAPNRNTASTDPITDTYVNTTGSDVTITYTVTPIGTNGCTGMTFTITVVVDGLTPGVIGNNQNVCVTKIPAPLVSTTPASSSAAITYQWEMSMTGCDGMFTPVTNEVSTNETLTFTMPLPKTTYFRRRAFSTRDGLQCEAVSNCVTITVLNVDCGKFPWNGND